MDDLAVFDRVDRVLRHLRHLAGLLVLDLDVVLRNEARLVHPRAADGRVLDFERVDEPLDLAADRVHALDLAVVAFGFHTDDLGMVVSLRRLVPLALLAHGDQALANFLCTHHRTFTRLKPGKVPA